MRGWNDYGNCCRAAARDRGAVFCPDCGHALFRCSAADCGGLVTALGHCPACIDLRLSLEKGAVLKARSGECLSVPFVIANNAPARSLSIATVLRDGTNMAQEPVPLNWERLDAGRTRAFAVAMGPFAHGGIGSLRLTVVASAAFDEVQETYAFSGDVSIEVEGPEPTQVVSTVNITGADFGTGGMVYAPTQASIDRGRRQAEALGARTVIALERAERFEVEHGYRGYERLAARIPRDVEFVYAGFPADDRPSDGPLPQRPVVRCGRNGRATGSRQVAQPNDLCLRIYDPASGGLDREASAAISRRACDFILANDRLYVRPLGDKCLAVNGEPLPAGDVRVVSNGDAFAAPLGRGKALRFEITFKVSAGLVSQVRFEKAS